VTAVAAPARTAPRPRRSAHPSSRRVNRGRPATRGSGAASRTAAPAGTGTARTTTVRATGHGRVVAFVVVATVLALVTAVMFHVVLAQHQMELDRLNVQIAKEQRRYEQDRLTTSALAAPQRVIQEAERLGLVQSPVPAQYLWVPDAPPPAGDVDRTTTTIEDWSKVKPNLGDQQP